jgi:integrase
MTEPITSDNIQLSRPITRRLVSADDGTPLSILSCSDSKILEFIAAATPPSTQRAYQSDLRHFVLWGGHLPATPQQVARYLADHASILSMATLARRLAGIHAAHVERGFPDPTKSALVRLTLRGIRRRFGRPQRRVGALSTDQLARIITSFGKTATDIRDAAMLLTGFAGAFRRSELVAIDRENVQIDETGATVLLCRGKTDQVGHGRTVPLPRVRGRLEFPDGRIALLTTLFEGQQATVLQLPAEPKTTVEAQSQRHVAYIA